LWWPRSGHVCLPLFLARRGQAGRRLWTC